MKTKHLLIFVSLTLAACNQPAEDPKAVADQYWQLMQASNTFEAKKLVSTNSSHLLPEHKHRMDSIAQLNNSEAKAIVNTTITTVDEQTGHQYIENFSTVLVLQEGQWKIDLSQSKIPPAPGEREAQLRKLTDDLSESMQENIESIDEAMSEGMELLNDALQDGSKEMGDSLLNFMNELNQSMKESINKMKDRRQQQMQEQEPGQEQQEQQSQPNPAKGEGMI